MNTADKEQAAPITAPLLSRLVAAKQAREDGVTEPLNPAVYADLTLSMQKGLDHIARRDRQWTDVMDSFRGTPYGSAP